MIRSRNLFLAALAASPISAQQLAEGYTSAPTSLPAGSGSVLTTSAGVVAFDGFDLMLHPAGGGAPQSLLTFANYTFGSFTTQIGPATLAFGESSNGEIWSVSLTGQAPTMITTVPYNYDAVVLTGGRMLLSAKTGGFSSPDNDVVFLDLATGSTQLLAQFPGASGPLAVDDAGDVYYATSPASFPPPAGTVSILRLTKATVDGAIATGQVLGTQHAQVVWAGLDAAGDLAFDDDGDLFYVDWFSNVIGELDDATGNQPSLGDAWIDYTGTSLSGSVLQFLPGPAGALSRFEPFQPAGSAVRVYETDYATVSQVREVSPQRPQLQASIANPIPAGSFTLQTTGGPANGLAVLLFAPTAATGAVALAVPGFEQPLLVDGALTTTQVLIGLSLDASGQASLGVQNPGFPAGLTATAQTVVLSMSAKLGTTAATGMQLTN